MISVVYSKHNVLIDFVLMVTSEVGGKIKQPFWVKECAAPNVTLLTVQ